MRWILAPATTDAVVDVVAPQAEVTFEDRRYLIDYELVGPELLLSIELDGYAFHSDRQQFTYDRLRQNDLHATGRTVLRFSYDAVRFDTARCVHQLQQLMLTDPLLATFVVEEPVVIPPDDMQADPLYAAAPPSLASPVGDYFLAARQRINTETLRECQREAFEALAVPSQTLGKS